MTTIYTDLFPRPFNGDLIHERNMSSILIRHDFWFTALNCNRIMVMNDGQITEEGDPVSLFTESQHSYTRYCLMPNQE